MKNNIEQVWIEAGYKIFAKEGPSGIKVGALSRVVDISRSSFYHLFADLDIYLENLLAYHYKRTLLAAEKIKTCNTVDPDLLLWIVEQKEYVLFNRQLRIYRNNPVFKEGFERAIDLMVKVILTIWAEMLQLQNKPDVALNIFKLSADIFYHRITEENINYKWLKDFLQEIKLFIKEVKENPSSEYSVK